MTQVDSTRKGEGNPMWSNDEIRARARRRRAEEAARPRRFGQALAPGADLFKPLSSAPILRRVNGCGSTIYGFGKSPSGKTLKVVWLTFLFVPIIPIAGYETTSSDKGGYYFHRKISLVGLFKLMGWSAAGLLMMCFLEGIFGGALMIALIAAVLGSLHWLFDR